MRGKVDRQQPRFIAFNNMGERTREDHPLRPIKLSRSRVVVEMCGNFTKAIGTFNRG